MQGPKDVPKIHNFLGSKQSGTNSTAAYNSNQKLDIFNSLQSSQLPGISQGGVYKSSLNLTSQARAPQYSKLGSSYKHIAQGYNSISQPGGVGKAMPKSMMGAYSQVQPGSQLKSKSAVGNKYAVKSTKYFTQARKNSQSLQSKVGLGQYSSNR